MQEHAAVLLVDRNPRFLKAAETVLRQRGYHALTADNGSVGWLKAVQYMPQVVVLGDLAGGRSRPALARTLSTTRRTQGSALIARGTFSRQEVLGLRGCGVRNFLIDPITARDLDGKVQQAVRESRTPCTTRRSKTENDLPATTNGSKATSDWLLDDSVPGERKVEAVASSVGQLLAFPATVQRVLAMTTREDTHASELGQAIAQDPAVLATVLRAANSVHYARAGGRMSDGQEAVVRLGFRTTRNLVLGLGVMKLFDEANQSWGFDRRAYWLHCLATGLAAQGLAAGAGTLHPERAFVAGLLHDLGKLVLDEFFPGAFRKVLEMATTGGISFQQAEEVLLGFDHARLGAAMLAAWNLPEDLQAAVAGHHHPRSADAYGSGPASLVRAGDLVAKALSLGAAGDGALPDPGTDVWKAAGCAEGLPRGFVRRLHREVVGLANSLGLGDALPEGLDEHAPTAVVHPCSTVLLAAAGTSPVNLVELHVQSLGYHVERINGPQGVAAYQASHGEPAAALVMDGDAGLADAPAGSPPALHLVAARGRKLPWAAAALPRDRDLRLLEPALRELTDPTPEEPGIEAPPAATCNA